MRILRTAALAAILSFGALALGGCFERIDTGNAGIVKGWSGEVKESTVPQGIYGAILSTVYEVSGKEDTIAFNDLKPKAFDQLVLDDLDVDITIQVNTAYAAKIYNRFSNDLHWHKEIGAYVVGTNYVTRQARAVIYRTVAKYEAQALNAMREKLGDDILVDLQKELDHDMGKDWIIVRNVNIRNLVTDKNVEANIRNITAEKFRKQEEDAKAEAEKSKNARLLIEKEGAARAQAKETEIAAEAKAKANKVLAESLTPPVLESLRIEMMREFAGKGNSTVLLPQNGITPLLNVGK
jgi:regulator of protease activity HflC (stomatin/prohibitin superfamily)